MTKKHIGVLMLVLLCGCATWTKTKPETYVDRSRDFSATLPDGWMRYGMADYFLITRDGIDLDAITVAKRRIEDKLEATKKKVTEDMMPMDVADVEIDNWKSDKNISDFTLVDNQPFTIDGESGFYLTFTFKTADGLKVKSEQYGFKYKEFLYRIRYEAPQQYYYDRYRADFERFIQSFKLNRELRTSGNAHRNFN